MPEKDEMLSEIRSEVSHRNLSARALARITGMHKKTVGDALKGVESTRLSTVTLLYSKLILERDRHATEHQASA
ncbi:hypothetical protein [Deinococcus irradiatisoli]|uniref:hypothetical protein n=1 Tax=Deinococcus irradiatisoli TaxID=2202254 RepID=UPI0011B29F1E|nr:hypothetical protein [Deinococcus irradiatisoli]